MTTRSIVPRADNEGGIGENTTPKYWKDGFFYNLYVKGSPWVDVKACGATGDGSTDDTATIQVAIDAGDVIFFPSGTYKIISDLEIIKNIFIVGCKGAILTSPDDASNIFSVGSSIDWFILEGLEFNNSSTSTAVEIKAGVTIGDLNIKDCVFDDLNHVCTSGATSNITQATIRNNIVTSSGGIGLDILTSNKVEIIDNKLTDISGIAVLVGRNSSSCVIKSVNVVDNFIKDVTGTAETHGILVYSGRAYIAGNHIENIDMVEDDPNSSEGIYTKSRFAKIIGNTVINGGTGEGFVCCKGTADGDLEGDQLIISNNVVYNDGTYSGGTTGIMMYRDKQKAEGNIVAGVTHGIGATGVINSSIANNTIYDVDRNGIAILPSGANVSTSIIGNQIFDYGGASTINAGIQLNLITYDLENSVIMGNKIFNATGQAGTAAIRFVGGATDGSPANLIIADNVFDTTINGIYAYLLDAADFDDTTLIHGNSFANMSGVNVTSELLQCKMYDNLTDDSLDVASATTVTLPLNGDFFNITGTTNITSVTASWVSRRVVLKFAGILTFTDGSNLKLAGDFVTSADDCIPLVCDGTNWYEESTRSAN